ncbi:MAG: hypothetical protein ACR2FH_08470, partial [Caulobacteraceae bacterium]
MLAALAWISVAASVWGQAASTGLGGDAGRTLVQEDPAIRRGVLANGLRYAVMHTGKQKGAVSIRLGIDAGSFEEAEDQR